LLDLVVDGINITARSGQGPALTLLYELSHVVAALGRGRRQRATLDLHAEELPWRLGVEADGEDTLLTVFRGGACPEVAVFERRVKTIDLRRALLDALAEASATGAGSDGPSFDQASAALRHPWPSYLGLNVPKRLCKVASKRSHGFGFGLEAEFRQRPQPLEESSASAQLEQADLHALLLEGRFKVTSKTRKVSVSRVQPFLLTERVLALAEDVMDAWQSERALFRRVEVDGIRLGVRRGAGDGPVTLTVNTEAGTPDGKTFSFAELRAPDFVRASVGLALELTRAFTTTDPSQLRNLRLTGLEASARHLGERLRDAELDDTHTNPEPETYRSFGLPRSEASVDGVWAHGARMRFMPRWVATVPGIDLRGTFLCGDRIIVGSQRELACIDRASGNVYWRAATAPATSVATPSGVVRLHPDGRVRLFDLETGEPKFTTHVAPRSGGGVSGALVNAPGLPRLLVVAEGERSVTAIDLLSGETRWRHSGPRSSQYRMKRAGKLLLLAGGHSALSALDVATGEVVWRQRDRLRFTGDLSIDHDAAFALCGGPVGPAKLHHIDLWTGKLRWSRELEDRPVFQQPPLVTQHQVLVVVRDKRGLGLTALSRETGEVLWEQAPGLVATTTAWLTVDDTVIANSASGTLLCIESDTGRLRYNHVFSRHVESEQPRRLEPVLRNGALFVPQHQVHVVRPRDGELIGTVPSDLIPDLLRVDERCDVYLAEESGHVAAFGAAPKLTLVK
jgi:outer membrane protein assembly factor BamB